MSYEGYERALCANGHLHVWDCYDRPDLIGNGNYEWDEGTGQPHLCSDCGQPFVWSEGVDQTNNAGWETVLKPHAPAEAETCPCCGHSKQLTPVSYCIPSNEGRRINKEVELNVPLAECEKKYQGNPSDLDDYWEGE